MLPMWKPRLMNKASRLAFVKAVLSAIPIHQLLVLAPPKRIIKALEKIQRGFLWAGRAEAAIATLTGSASLARSHLED